MIAAIAAAIIAPGFEPLAKIPLGLVLRRFEVARARVLSALAGYGVLIAGGAASFLILQAVGTTNTASLVSSPAAEHLAHPPVADVLVAVGGAFAGLVIQAAYRCSVIAGALVAMRLIDAAAAIGAALAAGAFELAWQAFEWFALDAALIVLAGIIVVWIKQRFVHQRAPLH